MRVRVNIILKPDILDAEGKAIEGVINRAGYDKITGVRVSKSIDMDIDADEKSAFDIAGDVADKLLINPVIHNAKIVKC